MVKIIMMEIKTGVEKRDRKYMSLFSRFEFRVSGFELWNKRSFEFVVSLRLRSGQAGFELKSKR